MSGEYGVAVPFDMESFLPGAPLVATRDAAQPDQLQRPRRVALLDVAARRLAVFPVLRGGEADGGPVAADDSADALLPQAGLYASRMAVGAGRELVVDVWHGAADGNALVTPLVFAPDGVAVVAALEGKFAPATALRHPDGRYGALRLTWPVCGASVLGLHLSGIGGMGNGIVVCGGVAPQLPAVEAAFPAPVGMRFTPISGANENLTTPDWAQA